MVGFPNNYGLSYLKWYFWGVLEVSPFKETPISFGVLKLQVAHFGDNFEYINLVWVPPQRDNWVNSILQQKQKQLGKPILPTKRNQNIRYPIHQYPHVPHTSWRYSVWFSGGPNKNKTTVEQWTKDLVTFHYTSVYIYIYIIYICIYTRIYTGWFIGIFLMAHQNPIKLRVGFPSALLWTTKTSSWSCNFHYSLQQNTPKIEMLRKPSPRYSPIGSMDDSFFPTSMVDFYGKLMGRYTVRDPMDPSWGLGLFKGWRAVA